jgi:formamidopyrimidine-DNA glycosylase
MPELPEVETIVRSLSPFIVGQRIASLRLYLPSLLRNDKTAILKKLRGKKILDLDRHGKIIIFKCEGNITLLLHLKMTGQLWLCERDVSRDKHTRFVLSLKGRTQELRFRDVRKFGFLACYCLVDPFQANELSVLGPDALQVDFAAFQEIFSKRKGRLKSLLLNQKFLAGIGNIYADEIMFAARLHPLALASALTHEERLRLWKSIRQILTRAIDRGGSSIRDYRDGRGRPGRYQNLHKVYGRWSLPCPRCRTSIDRLRLGSRSTFFCPSCQNLT